MDTTEELVRCVTKRTLLFLFDLIFPVLFLIFSLLYFMFCSLLDVGELKEDGTFGKNINSGRTSTNAWCHAQGCADDRLVAKVLQRLNDATGVPDANAEHLQLLRYEEDQWYQVHHDYIPFQRK